MKKRTKYILVAIASAIALYGAIKTGPDTDPPQKESDAISDAFAWAAGPSSEAVAPKVYRPNPFKKHHLRT